MLYLKIDNSTKTDNTMVPFYLHFWGYKENELHFLHTRSCTMLFSVNIRPRKKNMCVYCHMSKKSRVGRSGLIFFLLSAKPEIVVPGSGIQFRYFIFEIFGKMMNYAVFLYLLCSQFRQKASSWINKTLLLVKQQKWLFK